MAREFLLMKFDAVKAAERLNIFVDREIKAFQKAVRQTIDAVAVEIHRRASVDILGAGRFSARWPQALQANTLHAEGTSVVSVGFSSAIPYGHIHEFGGTIRGNPLLWIPLSFGDAPPSGVGSGRVSASAYPGRLFRVEREGRNPLLFSATGPQYVGVAQVTLRQRFHIRSITANVVRTGLAKMFARFVKGA